MKRSVLILSLCLPLQTHSQGYISFNNYGSDGSPFASIYGPEANSPQLQKWGNAANANPAGTQTYSGLHLTGTNYSVEGWYSLAPVTDVYALNTAASPLVGSQSTFYVGSGYFLAGFPFVPDSYNNGLFGVYLQVRAWDNGGGQYGSWNDAWNAAQAGSGKAVGWSKVFWQPVPSGVPPPAGLYNFESFNVFIAVPEPSSFALVALGGLTLLLFRRRNRV